LTQPIYVQKQFILGWHVCNNDSDSHPVANFLQPSRLWFTSATLHLRKATSLHTTEQHQLSPWLAELWVQLVK